MTSYLGVVLAEMRRILFCTKDWQVGKGSGLGHYDFYTTACKERDDTMLGLRLGLHAEVLASFATFGDARDENGDPLGINDEATAGKGG